MRLAASLALAVGLAASGFGVVFAAFSATTTNPANTFSAKSIFSGVRSAFASAGADASSGSVIEESDYFSAADGSLQTTGSWSNAFAANRWLEWDMSSPLPGGLTTSSVQFTFRFAADTAGETACFYVGVYRNSTSTLIGTHGSSGSPSGCVTGTTQTTFNVALAEVTTSDIANDLTIRVYGKESGSGAMRVDQAEASGSTPYQSFTLDEAIYRDQADTTLATTPWIIAAAGDGAMFTSGSNWQTTFATTRYIRLDSSNYVPADATITTATFTLAYRSNTGVAEQTCWYFAAYNGATLLGTHGSSGSPVSCASGSTTFTTNTVTMAELTAPADANNLSIRIYMKESATHKADIDVATVNVTYYRN